MSCAGLLAINTLLAHQSSPLCLDQTLRNTALAYSPHLDHKPLPLWVFGVSHLGKPLSHSSTRTMHSLQLVATLPNHEMDAKGSAEIGRTR